MKTKKIILLALFAVSAFTNCKGEEYCRSELTETQKQLIPYEMGQTVSSPSHRIC